MGFAIGGMALVLLPGAAMMRNIVDGLVWFVTPIVAVIANDTFAQFFGVTFGRKFIKVGMSSLSTKKSWEGFAGGALGAVACVTISTKLMFNSDLMRCPVKDLSWDVKPSCDAQTIDFFER